MANRFGELAMNDVFSEQGSGMIFLPLCVLNLAIFRNYCAEVTGVGKLTRKGGCQNFGNRSRVYIFS